MTAVAARRRSGGTPLVLAAALALLLGGPAPAAADTPPAPAALSVSVQDGMLTVDARNAPLADVLRAVAARAQLHLTMDGDLSPRITATFRDVPLEEGCLAPRPGPPPLIDPVPRAA